MNSPFKHDAYRTREKRLSYVSKSDTIYASNLVAYGTVIGCVIIDFYLHYVKWNLVQMESPIYVCMAAIACAVALDVPLAIAGVVLKRYHQGCCGKQEKNLVMVLAIGVFAIAFLCSFGFTYVTRDLVFTMGSAGTITNTVAETQQAGEQEAEHIGIVMAALYNSILPLLTSLASFIVSYFSYDPLKQKLRKYEKEKIGIQNNLMEAEKAMAEADDEYCERLIARENDKYAEMKQQINAENAYFKELTRMIMTEKMTTPDQNDAIGRNGKEVLDAYRASEKPLEKELPDYIMKHLRVGEDHKIVAVNTCPHAA